MKKQKIGVNVASKEQTTEISVAGGYSKSEIDKMGLKNIFKTFKPQKIKTTMIAGCTINAECNLVRKENLGDHVMLVGKVTHIKHDDTKSPLIYHKRRYFGLGSMMEPDRKEVPTTKSTLEFFKNLAQGRFVLKCVGVLIESKNKVFVIKWPKTDLETIPFNMPPTGKNQREHLKKSLSKVRLDIQIERVNYEETCFKKRKRNLENKFYNFQGEEEFNKKQYLEIKTR